MLTPSGRFPRPRRADRGVPGGVSTPARCGQEAARPRCATAAPHGEGDHPGGIGAPLGGAAGGLKTEVAGQGTGVPGTTAITITGWLSGENCSVAFPCTVRTLAVYDGASCTNL